MTAHATHSPHPRHHHGRSKRTRTRTRTLARSLGAAALSLASTVALTVIPSHSASAAPANDAIADALPITGQWTVADLVGATLETGEPDVCIERDPDFSSYEHHAGATVWYRYTAPARETVNGQVYDYSDLPISAHIFREVDGVLEHVTCADDETRPWFSFQAEAGEEFLVQLAAVAGYPGTEAAVVEFPATLGESFLVQVGGYYLHRGEIVLSVSRRVDAPPTVTRTSPVLGPRAGGTTVTITGTGFTPDSQVSFGALPATSVVYVSPTSLKAVTPRVPSARLVEVQVTTPAGTSPKALLAKFLYVR